MTDLSWSDRFFRWQAGTVERRALQLVAPQSILRGMFALTAPLSGSIPKDIKPMSDSDGALWFTPPEVGPNAPLLMYLHGGGFTIGSPNTHAALVAHLARFAGMRAISIPYRLAPEHPFPAARDDAVAAYDRLVAAGTPPVAICGDSAGGCLALQVAQHARDTSPIQPRALGLIAPVADLSGDIAHRFEAASDEILIPPAWARRILTSYLAGADPTDPAVSPLLGDLTGLPPTMIQAATGEALVQDAQRLEQKMENVTLDLWPDLAHVWHLHAGRSKSADMALRRLGAFLRDAAG
jgi:acetyl esterase/lipase